MKNPKYILVLEFYPSIENSSNVYRIYSGKTRFLYDFPAVNWDIIKPLLIEGFAVVRSDNGDNLRITKRVLY